MKEIQKRLLDIYNQIIKDLEQINSEHRTFLEEAQETKDVPQDLVFKRMTLARDNLRRLQIAKAEKELIENYNL